MLVEVLFRLRESLIITGVLRAPLCTLWFKVFVGT